MSLIIKDNTRVLNSSMSYMDFHLALTQNRQDDAKFLIQNGLDLNLPNNYNCNTAIFTGVCANNIEIVEFLINYGANIHHKNAFGDTALHAALVLEYFDLALLLFHHGANPYEQNKFGETPVYLAMRCKTLKIRNDKLVLSFISKEQNQNFIYTNGLTLLHHAMYWENFAMVIKLLNSNTMIDIQDIWGRTPLMIAVENNKLNYVQQLIFRNANVNLQNLTGKTALHIAIGVLNTNFDIINKLLKYGANPTIKSFHNGNTPIEEAILQGRKDIANYIKKF